LQTPEANAEEWKLADLRCMDFRLTAAADQNSDTQMQRIAATMDKSQGQTRQQRSDTMDSTIQIQDNAQIFKGSQKEAATFS